MFFDGEEPMYFLNVLEKYDIFSNPQFLAAAETDCPSEISRFASLHLIIFMYSNTDCPVILLNSLVR